MQHTGQAVKGEHESRETIEIDFFYPDHEKREETALFRKTKHDLIHKQGLGCWICGTKELLECHHFGAEWADSQGIDWNKMRAMYHNFDWSTFKEPADFIDSPANMMILCAKHHRHKNHGIHFVPYPIWIMQKIKRDDFIFSPDEIPGETK